MFKALNGLAPPYIAELLSPPWQYQDTKILQRFLKFQMANLQQKGDRAFFVAQGFGTASHPLLGSPPPWIFSDPDLRLTFSLNIWALLLILALWTCFICILCPEMSVLFLLFLLSFWLSYPAVQHFGDLTWPNLPESLLRCHYTTAVYTYMWNRNTSYFPHSPFWHNPPWLFRSPQSNAILLVSPQTNSS